MINANPTKPSTMNKIENRIPLDIDLFHVDACERLRSRNCDERLWTENTEYRYTVPVHRYARHGREFLGWKSPSLNFGVFGPMTDRQSRSRGCDAVCHAMLLCFTNSTSLRMVVIERSLDPATFH